MSNVNEIIVVDKVDGSNEPRKFRAIPNCTLTDDGELTLRDANVTSGEHPGINFLTDRGTAGLGAWNTDDVYKTIHFKVWDVADNAYVSIARMVFTCTATSSTDYYPTKFSILLNPGDADSFDQFVLDAPAGTLCLFGQTPQTDASLSGYGMADFYAFRASATGSPNGVGTVISYNDASDQRTQIANVCSSSSSATNGGIAFSCRSSGSFSVRAWMNGLGEWNAKNYGSTLVDNGTVTTAVSLNFTTGERHKFKLTASTNCTVSKTNPTYPCRVVIILEGSTTTTPTITWFTVVGGTMPATITATKKRTIYLDWDGTNMVLMAISAEY